MYRWAKDSDKDAVMRLWAIDFESYEPYFSWYFTQVYRPELTLCDFAGADLAAALQLAPYTLSWRGKALQVCYVVGVITDPAFRRQGRGQALLREAHMRMERLGFAAALLYTDIPEFYAPLGYTHYYQQQTLLLPAAAPSWAETTAGPLFIEHCLPKDSGALAEIYQAMTERYDGYIIRDERNWRIYLGEHACDGARLLLWEKRAYVLYTLKREELHIIELGFSNTEALAAALEAAIQAARASNAARLLWHAPVDAPRLLPQIAEKNWSLRPFVMVRPRAGTELAGSKRPLWINEYT